MSIQEWSDRILLSEPLPEPQLSEELLTLAERVVEPVHDAVINLSHIKTINSSNLAQLLRVRQRLVQGDRRLRLCGLNDGIWGVFLATGLDKVFDFAEDVGTALASLQMK